MLWIDAMTNQQKINLMLSDVGYWKDYWQVFVWVLDITDEECAGTGGYLPMVSPPEIRQLAHKIGCCHCYAGKKKHQKALRRLIRKLSKSYPDVLDAALDYTFEEISDCLAESIFFDGRMMRVKLQNGIVKERSVDDFPLLADATEDQLKNYRLLGYGIGIHWPELDEDLLVRNL
jgi:hypothetical protein